MGGGHSQIKYPCFSIIFKHADQSIVQTVVVKCPTRHEAVINTRDRSFVVAFNERTLPAVVYLINKHCIPVDYDNAFVISNMAKYDAPFPMYQHDQRASLCATIEGDLRIFLVLRQVHGIFRASI